MALGDRHIGYRCTQGKEDSVRKALGVQPKAAWILGGVPLSFTHGDASGLLEDMGAQAKLLPHTRKVIRGFQSWVVHMAPTASPREDTLHVASAGKDFFVTLVPIAARVPRSTTVREFARPVRRRDPDTTYSEAAQNFPPLPRASPPAPRIPAASSAPNDPIAHIQRLEELIRTLVGLMASQSIPLSKQAQSLLHGLPMTNLQRDSDDLSDGADSLDQHMGDYDVSDNKQHPAPNVEDDSFVEEPPKRPRTSQGPSDAMQWAHLDSAPFQHLAWGRVAGDGNCYWRSIGQLIGRDWQGLKREILGGGPALAAAWTGYFGGTLDDYSSHIQKLQGKDVWGSEVAAALTAAWAKRPVVIVTAAVIWSVTVGTCDMEAPLVVRLAAKHYDPLKQMLSPALLAAVASAVPADTTHLKLEGGAHSVVTTWNLSAYDSHHMEAAALSDDVVLLQETGVSTRSQGMYSRKMEALGIKMVWGFPTPVVQNKRRQWRPNKGAVPGVAIQTKDHIRAVPVEPTTPQVLFSGRRAD